MRVDSGVVAGSEVTPLYDPLIAKLIAWDTDRERATARMLRALSEYEIGGLVTLVPFHKAILATEQWRDAETCRDLLGDRKWLKSLEPSTEASSATASGARSRAPSPRRWRSASTRSRSTGASTASG